jgi:hypothetical protein
MHVGQVTTSQMISRQGNIALLKSFSVQNGALVQMSGAWLLWYANCPNTLLLFETFMILICDA